jgi:hypothetical protein
MPDKLTEIIKKDKEIWSQFQDSFLEIEIPSKTVLLHDGEISCHIYNIKKAV